MDRPTCETCAFWSQHDTVGLCCRRSPKPSRFQGAITYWPETEMEDWCGEHHLFPAYLASLSSGEPAPETEPDQVEVLEDVPDELYMLWVCGSDEKDGHWAHPIDEVRGGEIYLVLTDHETAKIAAKEQMEKYPSLGTITAVRVL